MGYCPAECQDLELLANPAVGCATSRREKTLSRILFFSCALELPDPITSAIAAMFADGSIVASMPMGNIVVAEPTISEIMMDDCSPAERKIDTREITFEDRFAVQMTSGSPAVVNNYFDYDFWQNKIQIQTSLNYMLVYCDGDVIIPKLANGQRMTASLLVYLSFQKAAQQGGSSIEFKKGSIIFQGDPFSFINKPEFNLVEYGIAI